ncbi:MAG: DUF1540 domain-containing protein [Firmicutes bacterium]|nr:DUF1540 domain-containing protein [Bacillota bacterium]
MPDVHCTVNTCRYYKTGNLCTAENIVIQTDAAGGFGPNAKMCDLKATPANTKDQTCCQTFRPAGG